MFGKKLWIYWDSGIENAPDVVQVCVASWKKFNPEYEIHILSDKTLSDYIDPGAGLKSFSRLTIQKRSNIIRKQLVARYGGIWVDSTVLCIAPLSEWFPDATQAGFLVLKNYNPDRLLCNWFIASEPQNEFIQAWLDSTIRYFSIPKKPSPPRHLASLHKTLMKSTMNGGRALSFWTSWVGTRFWPAYPHFISHYLAAKLLLKDKRFAKVSHMGSIFPSQWGPWALRNRIPAYGDDPQEGFFDELQKMNTPLMKLSHRPTSPERQLLDPVMSRLWMWTRG